jgi:hypothetical protein
MSNSTLLAQTLTDRDLIESVLQCFYIIDYGYIKTVNQDKTVDVIHAKRLKTFNGQTLPQTETKGIEMLTLAGSGFSIQFDYKKGDKVLLLGLKDFIPKVKDVTGATETTNYLHYTRETMKALPLCIFNDQAKVVIKIENGDLDIKTNGKIKLNGDSKQFVTWAELNQALTTFLTALNGHVHTSAVSGSPTSSPVTPMTLDISSAKTTTVVTGG